MFPLVCFIDSSITKLTTINDSIDFDDGQTSIRQLVLFKNAKNTIAWEHYG